MWVCRDKIYKKGPIVLKAVLTLLALVGSLRAGADAIEFKNFAASNVKAGAQSFTFSLLDSATGRILTDSDLKIAHEKKLHFLVYDAALSEFRHEHPEFHGGVWTVSFDLPREGAYRVWAQGVTLGDGKEFSAMTDLRVSGGLPANPVPSALGDVREGVAGVSRVTLASGAVQSGNMEMLDLKFTRSDGSAVKITPYLGAIAHIVAVPLTGDQLLHVHPMAMGSDAAMVHVTFPTTGDYRLWVQFIDDGILRVVPLSLSVQ